MDTIFISRFKVKAQKESPPAVLEFPFMIPGYGQITDPAAWEIFKRHYRGMAATLGGQVDPALEEAIPVEMI